ncbi:MAG: CHAT domain-containing protein [Oscillatoria sp. SIO1A7]|nr:CHAT domain-containing protein [Oscillatoria sp. SIO1A7]
MKPTLGESANQLLRCKSASNSPNGLSLIVTLILAAVSSGNEAIAQPITPAADGTGTLVEQNGNQFDITGGSPSGANLFHSFEQFGLDANQTANFLATPNLRNILGRVVGGDPSIINGLIQVTGGNPNLFLMNPAGMVFGPDARLNVPASFFATTASGIGFGENLWFGAIGSNDYAALVGEPRAFSFSGLNGALANFGELTVNPGQSLGLSGSSVLNAGTLTAPGGEITITAVPGTNTVLLGQAGHLLSLQIDNSGLASLRQPTNLPSLLANNSSIHASQVTVNPNGTVTLAGSSLNNVPTTAGTAIIAGSLDVSGNWELGIGHWALGGRSSLPISPHLSQSLPTSPNLSPSLPIPPHPSPSLPTVGIFGRQLGIAANIDASGAIGGGRVFIGGDLQGGGSLPTALYTFVGNDSKINADALNSGDGGSVVIWADENTFFDGTISARGGANGGDGGFVETSGKINLGVGSGASVDASAINGQAGDWLLDPSDITISNGSTTATASGGNPNVFDTTGASANVTPATIEASLNAGTSVTVTTAGGSGGNGDITVSDEISKTAGGEATLTLEADRNIDINANISSTADKLNVVLDATAGINITGATITTNGGNFTATAMGSGLAASTRGIEINNSTVNAGAGNISLTGSAGSGGGTGNIGVRVRSGGVLETTAGAISITGNGGSGTDNNEGVEINSGSVRSGSGSISITGTGAGTGSANEGIHILSGSTIESTGGDITFHGTGGAGTASNRGILLEGPGTRISAVSGGKITLRGTGGNGSDRNNDGVQLSSDAALATDTGAISITGYGGSGTDNNEGVEINSISVSSGSGAIEITGTSKGTGSANEGIAVQFSTIESTGGGDITFHGTGGAGTASNRGILLQGTRISAVSGGKITLRGTGGNGSDRNNDGVQLSSDAALATDTGAISITGYGGSGTDNNEGVEINSISVSSGSGAIEITGTSKGTGSANEGIAVQFSTIESTGGGDITLDGRVSAGTRYNLGILVNGTGTRISAVSGGKITLSGTGGNGSDRNNDGVQLSSDAALATDTGAISITGNGGSGTNYNNGVEINSGSVSSGSGAIEITGTSKGTGSGNDGIEISSRGTIESTGGGDITLSGTGSAGTRDNRGILVSGTETRISAVSGGSITLLGKGGNGSDRNNDGVLLNSGGTLATDTGAISITGYGASGTNYNNGVEINSGSVSSGSGAIEITGTAGGTGSANEGISVQSSTIESTGGGDVTLSGRSLLGTKKENRGIYVDRSTIGSTGGGNITLTGTGSSAGTGSNDGIGITGVGTSISASGAGNITLSGTAGGNGTRAYNNGVEIYSGATLDTDAGAISITGIGGSGTNGNEGVEVKYAVVRSQSGAINVTGTGGENGSDNRGILVENGVVESASSGDITLTGTGIIGIELTDSSINPSGTATGNVTLSGNEIDLIGTSQVQSSGNLLLQPLTPIADIAIGGSSNTTGTLDVTSEDLGSLAEGFASVTIGRADSSGAISIEAGVTFSDSTTVRSPGGSIAVNGNIMGTGDASIALSGDTTLNANIETASQNIAINGNTTLGNNASLSTGSGSGNINLNGTVNGNRDLTLDAGTGNITVTGAIGNSQALGNISANSSGNTNFSSSINAASLTTDALGSTELNGNVTTAGSQIYNGALTINGDVELRAKEIDFGSVVSGTGNLSLQPATAEAQIIVGGSSDRGSTVLDLTASDINNLADGFSSITIGRSDAIGDVELGSISASDPLTVISGSGSAKLNGAITGNDNASIALTFGGGIELLGNSSVQTANQDINFNGTVNGSHSLSVSPGRATVSFADSIGNVTPLVDLSITADEIDFYAGTVRGSGNLLLQPATTGRKVNLRVEETGVGTFPDALDLTVAEIGRLQDGFSSITFPTDSSGTVSSDSANSPVTPAEPSPAPADSSAPAESPSNPNNNSGNPANPSNPNNNSDSSANPSNPNNNSGNPANPDNSVNQSDRSNPTNSGDRSNSDNWVNQSDRSNPTNSGDRSNSDNWVNQSDRSNSGNSHNSGNLVNQSDRGNSGNSVNQSDRSNSDNWVNESDRGNSGNSVNQSDRGNSGNSVNESDRGNSGNSVNQSDRGNSGNSVNQSDRGNEANERNLGNPTVILQLPSRDNPANSNNFSNGANAGNPGNSVNSGNSGNPGNSNNFGNSGNPGNPGNSGNSGNPGNPGNSVNPVNSSHQVNSSNPVNSSNATNPNNFGNSGNSGSPGNLGIASNPNNFAEAFGNADNLDIASNPGNPGNANNLAEAIALTETPANLGNPVNSINPVNPVNPENYANLGKANNNLGFLLGSKPENSISPGNFVGSGNNAANLGVSLESLISSFEYPNFSIDLQGSTLEALEMLAIANSAKILHLSLDLYPQQIAENVRLSAFANDSLPATQVNLAELNSDSLQFSGDLAAANGFSGFSLQSAIDLAQNSQTKENSIASAAQVYSESSQIGDYPLKVASSRFAMYGSSSENSNNSIAPNSSSDISDNSASSTAAGSSEQNSANSSEQNSANSSEQNSANSSEQNSAAESEQNSANSSEQNSAGESGQNSAGRSSGASTSDSSQFSRGNDSFSSGGGVSNEARLTEAFEEDDTEATVWQIEQYRNQEFEEHLGVRANIENQSIAIANFRKELKRLSVETSHNYAVVYVVSRPEQLEIVVLTGAGDPARLSIPEAKREIILPLAKKFRGELTDLRKLRTTSYLPVAQQLYQLIVAPMEAILQERNIDTLLFSMDPGLRSLAVAALHDGEQFLAEKYSTAVIPSFSLSDLRYRSLENASVLAFGASEFTKLAPLPAVPVELATITSELGVEEFFLNEDFTLENLQSQRSAKPMPIIHLATHAEFVPGVASNSYIQLWDEKLTLDQLPGLGWSEPMVDLLVISACRSALGDKEAELGLAGIAVQSGVKTALASLWYVSDEGTLVLMSEFYRQLKQVPIKAEALRLAQLAMIRGELKIENGRIISSKQGKDIQLPEQLAGLTNDDLSHPYYWSAFTAIGSPW